MNTTQLHQCKFHYLMMAASLFVLVACMIPFPESRNLSSVTDTPTPIPTQTPTPLPDAVVVAKGLNVRSGPGTNYERIDLLTAGEPLAVLGKSFDCTWLFVRTTKESNGWVAASYVTLNLPCASLTEVAAPETPTPPLRPTPTLPVQTPSRTVALSNPKQAVELVKPLTTIVYGRQEFAWQPNFVLQPGEAFEMIFWEPGQEPMVDGFGPGGTSTTNNTVVNLEAIMTVLPQRLIAGRQYQWGVLLVRPQPYKRLAYLGGGHTFHLAHVAGLVEGDTPVPTRPAATNTPRG